jgi:Saxitoxin biosynthesis operon protein SxtJ
MHENLEREEEVHGSSDRSFGLVMAAGFALVGLLPLAHGSLAGVRWWAVALAAVFLALALYWTAPLAPLNRLWLKFGLLLHRIISPLILALLFYVTVLPIGLIMRALGKDPLRLKFEPAADSYWIPRDPPGPAPTSMKNQF